MVFLSTRRFDEKIRIGGVELNALKNEYGAKLTVPSAPIVLAQAIGRGATAPSMNWWKSFVGVVDGLTWIMVFSFWYEFSINLMAKVKPRRSEFTKKMPKPNNPTLAGCTIWASDGA